MNGENCDDNVLALCAVIGAIIAAIVLTNWVQTLSQGRAIKIDGDSPRTESAPLEAAISFSSG